MKAKVKTKSGDVALDEYQLFQFLLGRVIDNKDSTNDTELASDTLTKVLSEYLQAERKLASLTSEQLIKFSMNIGYYFRVFLDKNDVDLVFENIGKDENENILDGTPSEPSN